MAELPTLHDALHRTDGVILVVNREVLLTANDRCDAAQHARTERVKGATPHTLRFVPEELGNARAHFASGLVGERDRQDLVWSHSTVADQAGDACGEHARLAGAGTGQDQRRTNVMKNGFTLTRIEASREFFKIERRRRWHRVEKGTGPTRRRHPFKITSNAAPRPVSASTSFPS